MVPARLAGRRSIMFYHAGPERTPQCVIRRSPSFEREYASFFPYFKTGILTLVRRRGLYAAERDGRVTSAIRRVFSAWRDEFWWRHRWLAPSRNRRAPPLDKRSGVSVGCGAGAPRPRFGRGQSHGPGRTAPAWRNRGDGGGARTIVGAAGD